MVLALNGGSSSVKFALFGVGSPRAAEVRGEVERVGEEGATLRATGAGGDVIDEQRVEARSHGAAGERVLEWVEERLGGEGGVGGSRLAGIGHRIVHGGRRWEDHQRLAPEMVDELKGARDLDPAHLPREIELIETCERRFPDVGQVLCFDTVFHIGLPRAATLFPIPRRYDEAGVRRYGFHGLSYEYLMRELARTAGREAAAGRVILAHLGSGASMAAVRGGRPVDTTMGFTPTAGLVMGTRCGDLDPGILVYLARREGMDGDALDDLVNRKSGLLGMSGTSADMRDLLGRRGEDVRAAEAVEVFCRQSRKWIGALAAVLGGVDTLVFSGGIGERSAEVRAEICAGLDFLGIRIDSARNASGEGVVSADRAGDGPGAVVRVIHTDEEAMIAEHTIGILGIA